jgi:hypothetical protein
LHGYVNLASRRWTDEVISILSNMRAKDFIYIKQPDRFAYVELSARLVKKSDTEFCSLIGNTIGRTGGGRKPIFVSGILNVFLISARDRQIFHAKRSKNAVCASDAASRRRYQ